MKNFLDSDEIPSEPVKDKGGSQSLFGDNGEDKKDDEPYVLSKAAPQSMEETVRTSGLAWSAGIVLFASVVFMMIIGWGADLLFGSTPWGIVGGIVLGAVIGFVQFFRLTSQIFKK
jgi:F0F1-type ATP synthase assembly protein I